MRRITCLTDFALALFCMLHCVPIASGQQTSATGTPQPVAGPVHFYFCASNQIGMGHTAYISNIFAVSKQNSPPIENEYLGFLKKRYSYPANQTACFDGYLTQEAVRAARQTRIEQFEQIKDKVVETPWTYSAALSDSEIHPQPTRVSPPPAPSSRVREAAPEAAPVAASTPAAPTAAGVGTPPPAPQGQDPRLAQIPEPFRRQALASISTDNHLPKRDMDFCPSQSGLGFGIEHSDRAPGRGR